MVGLEQKFLSAEHEFTFHMVGLEQKFLSTEHEFTFHLVGLEKNVKTQVCAM